MYTYLEHKNSCGRYAFIFGSVVSGHLGASVIEDMVDVLLSSVFVLVVVSMINSVVSLGLLV